MDFKKFLPKKEDTSQKEYFWSLVIEPNSVQAGIWRIEADKTQVVLHSPPFSWETNEDLVQAADNTLSTAIQGFPEDLNEPQKTVFGVSSLWVSEGTIKSEYLAKIKVVCSELSLTPIGFVVLSEAIAHLIKSKEGSPLNSVVVGVYKDFLEISIFRLGNLLGTTEVSRSVSIVDDVVEGLARFGLKEPVPSRILLFDSREGELEDVRQALLKVNWEDETRLKFLHTPKVEIIQPLEKVFAVSLAGASEMASVKSVESLSRGLGEVEEKKIPEESFAKSEEQVQEEQKLTPEELGFAVDRDIAEDTGIKKETKIETLEKGVEEEFEWAEPGKGVAQFEDIHKNIEPADLAKVSSKVFRPFRFDFGFITVLFSKLKEKFSFTRMPEKERFVGQTKDVTKPFFYGGLFFAVLIIIGGIAWWVLPKALVTIYVSPRKLAEELEISVDTSKTSSNVSNAILKGELLEVSLQGEKTRKTTGIKTVGEKAKGEVTLYRVGSEVTLPRGTILLGPGDLRFSLEEEVKIASGSAGTAGVAKAEVIAEGIGADYNLAAGTTFRVDNYSPTDLEAKNEASFSGGSSRQVTAVSEEDQKILEEELGNELKEKAKNELLKKVSNEKLFINESLSITVSSKEFSNKVDDEAENLKLSLEVKALAAAVSKEEIAAISKDVLKNKIPEGFVLRGDQMDYDFKLKSFKDGVYEFTVRITANLLPDVNTGEIRAKIRGRNPTVTQEFLEKEVPGFVKAEIKIRPSLPAKLRTLPHLTKNIEIEVAAEK